MIYTVLHGLYVILIDQALQYSPQILFINYVHFEAEAQPRSSQILPQEGFYVVGNTIHERSVSESVSPR